MTLSCMVTFSKAPGIELAGFTKDISRSGLSVRLPGSVDPAPRLGTPARVVVALPHSPNLLRTCLDCTATVVRVEQGGSGEPVVAFEMRRVRLGSPRRIGGSLPASATETPSFGFLQ